MMVYLYDGLRARPGGPLEVPAAAGAELHPAPVPGPDLQGLLQGGRTVPGDDDGVAAGVAAARGRGEGEAGGGEEVRPGQLLREDRVALLADVGGEGAGVEGGHGPPAVRVGIVAHLERKEEAIWQPCFCFFFFFFWGGWVGGCPNQYR